MEITRKKNKFTGYLMSQDKIIGEISNNEVVSIDNELAPLYIKNTGDFEGWLKFRSIDLHRTNSRLLRKVLRLNTNDEVNIVLSVHGLAITDTYWVKEKSSNLTYRDVRFTTDKFSDLALFGDPNAFSFEASLTPEMTNIGSYEKCWKVRNGNWYMYKQGSVNERFSEIFAFKLGKKLGFNMAEYKLIDKYIVSEDFTDNASVNFEPMYSLVLEDEDYKVNIEALTKIDAALVKQYMDIIFLDTIVMNVDRHTFNYGLIRDVNSGKILSMAPNFDNNLSLISRGYAKNTDRNDLLVKLFKEVLEENKYKIPVLSKELIRDTAEAAAREFEDEFDIDYIVDFCMNAYYKL
ncbi:MAG: hypothetical protein Q8936_09300 [Bacillota bacterium]|nr:hypothetical protein [Bacillota bacterium]